MKILISEPEDYSELALSVYQSLGELSLGNCSCEHELDVMVVRLGKTLDSEFLEAYPNLKYILSPTTGLTHIDLDYCEKNLITIVSLMDCESFLDRITSTAELTLGLIISLLRNIPQANADVTHRGIWDRNLYKSRQMAGMTLGIIGVGRVGGQLAAYASAMRMKVIGYDPHRTDAHFETLGVCRANNLVELIKEADIVSVNASYTAETKNLIGEEEIKAFTFDKLLVNTSRGELLDEKAVVTALKNESLGGLGVDVLQSEFDKGDIFASPIIQAAQEGLNIIVLPHIAGCSIDAMHMTEEFVAQSFVELVNEK